MSVVTLSAAGATGPRTAEGRRIAARSATTHGLFARDVVLPRFGEDPAAYELFLAELTRQLNPKNLLEQHYAEKIAAASWRLRRLHRWQAQLFEDMEMPEDAVMLKMDRVMRHETTLHRQIDTSIKMLGRELPRLFEGRVREGLIRRMNETERGCKDDPYLDQWITEETRKRSSLPTVPPSLDLSRLDLSRLDTAPIAVNCENEPAPVSPISPCSEGEAGRGCSSPCSEGEVARNEPEGVLNGQGVPHANCQNEPAPAAAYPLAEGEAREGAQHRVSISALRKAGRLKRQQKCQNEPAVCTGMACHAPTPPASGFYWGGVGLRLPTYALTSAA